MPIFRSATSAIKPLSARRAPQQTTHKPQGPAKQKAPGAFGQDQLTLSQRKPVHAPAKPPVAPPPPPPPPVAESPEKAVEAALQGQAIQLPLPKGAKPLTLTAKGELDGYSQYDATLGSEHFTLALAKDQPAQAAIARTLSLYAHVPDDLRQPISLIRIDDASVENAHFRVTSQSLNGAPETVEFRRTGNKDGHDVYDLTLAGSTLQVLTPTDDDIPWELAQTAWLYDQVPARLRGVLKTVDIEDGANPQDAYWAETYKMPNFVSAASASQGVTHFWNGQRSLWDDTFHHEFGHSLGQALSTKNGFTPDGWEEAIASDAVTPTDYSKASPAEDFAESWSAYIRVKEGKTAYYAGVKDLAAFTQRFPARAKLLEAIYTGEIPLPTPAAPVPKAG